MSTVSIELDIQSLNGKAQGTAAARDEQGKTIHQSSGNWFSDVTRNRFCTTVARKLHPEIPIPAGSDQPRADAEILTQVRQSTVDALERLFLDQLDKAQGEAEKIVEDKHALPSLRTGFTPKAENIIDWPVPLRIGEHYINARALCATGDPTLRMYRGQWFRFSGCGYILIDDAVQRAEIYNHLDQLWVPKRDKETGKPTGEFYKLEAKAGIVREVELALPACGLLVSGDKPQWLDGRTSPDPQDVVAFKNGMLDTTAYRDGNTDLIPPSPRWFSGVACPYNFDPASQCPLWLAFLADVFDGDLESIALLQEWFGISLIPDNQYERLMMLVGKPRSGKGTTIEMLMAMLGKEQIAVTSFTKLASRFGLHPLLGKLAAILPDAHINRATDASAALEVLKSITGNDDQAIDRKGVDELPRVHLGIKFTIAVNELPQLPDEAGALKPRLLMLYYGKTYAGREDTGLKARLRAEAAGVVNWALEGLCRLREQGTFTAPARSKVMIDEFERTVSPVKAFVHECCEIEPGSWIEKKILFDGWEAWCKDRRSQPGSLPQFGQQLLNAYPDISTKRRGPAGQQFTTYEGVRLC